MSCGPRTPVFWQRQPRLPLPVLRFLGSRLEAALAEPRERAHLVWPAVLGAPRVREEHPGGLPEAELLARAAPMLAPVLPGVSPQDAWRATREAFPDTADRGPTGWVPQRVWDPLASLVSLRAGVTLLALLGLPEDSRYTLAAGVSLFNAALFHECHDALEPLWMESPEPRRTALQGLIMLAGGYHHHQLQNAPGMASLWEDALPALAGSGPGALATPWGTVTFGQSLGTARSRLAALENLDGERCPEPPWDLLWTLERPEWELT